MTANRGSGDVVWARLAICLSHRGRRCLPSRAFADVVAHRRFDLTVVECKSTASWHIERTPPEAQSGIPCQRTAP